METKKKTKKKEQQPAHMVREGAIAASIWKRNTQTGHFFWEMSLSRSYLTKSSGKQGYSSNFSARNSDALTKVIAEASAWMKANDPEEIVSEAA